MEDRPIPKDGTAILLYEKSEGHRTYSDHEAPLAALTSEYKIIKLLSSDRTKSIN